MRVPTVLRRPVEPRVASIAMGTSPWMERPPALPPPTSCDPGVAQVSYGPLRGCPSKCLRVKCVQLGWKLAGDRCAVPCRAVLCRGWGGMRELLLSTLTLTSSAPSPRPSTQPPLQLTTEQAPPPLPAPHDYSLTRPAGPDLPRRRAGLRPAAREEGRDRGENRFRLLHLCSGRIDPNEGTPAFCVA